MTARLRLGPRLSRSRYIRAERDLALTLALLGDGEPALAQAAAERGLRWLSRDGRLAIDTPAAQRFATAFGLVAAGRDAA